MSIRYLDLSGAVNFWTNIKNYILSKIPTKTSELTNDSGFITQHQSLSNYVTLNSEQTITGKKLFTASSIQLDSVTSMYGSTMLIDTSASAPRGAFPSEAHRVGRVYIGDGQSYNGAWFIVDPIIDTNKAYYRMVTTNPDNTDSTRFSIVWDSTKEGVRRRKNVSQGDLLPSANNTYNLGADDLKWDIGYIHNLIGTNKENLTEDANDYYSTTSGSHMTFYTTTNGGTKLSNVPAAVNTHLESRTIRYLSSSDWTVEQICHNTSGLYYRKGTNGTWEDWKTFAFTNSDITGKASNVTGTVAIANGGTGATTRLNAVKALTNEAVASPTHFLAITTNYAKAGYTSVAQAKTVLGITGDMGSHSDSEYVHKTGNETIAGTKTFSSTITGSISGNASTASQFSANKSVTLTGDVTGTASSKAGWSVSTTLSNSGVTAGTYGPSADVTGNNNATISVPEITVDAKGRVTSVTNRTLTCKNNTYSVYNKTLTIQKNGTNVATFTSNSNTNVTANITVPTKTSELTNDSGYLTSHQSLSSCVKNAVTNNQIIKSTGITRGTAPSSAQTFGIGFSDKNNKYIGNIYGQFATDKSTYVGLYAYKGTTTSNGDNAYVRVGYDASGNVYTSAPTPATTDNSTQIATTAFVKAQGYLTSHQSLANYVTLNTAQDIEGNKNFKGLLTTIPNDTIWPVTASTTDDITYLGANAIHVEQKSSGKLTDLSGGAWSVAELGVGCFFFRINNGTDIRYKNFAQNTVNRIPVVSGANRFINDVTPNENNTHSLGTSSLQWKNAYINNLILNGHTFNPASVSGNIGDVVFASAYYSSIMGTADLDLTVSGDALYLAGFDNNILNVDSTASSLAGTWKFLGIGKAKTTSGNADTRRTGLWKRIA